jgi:hypothetical protein
MLTKEITYGFTCNGSKKNGASKTRSHMESITLFRVQIYPTRQQLNRASRIGQLVQLS